MNQQNKIQESIYYYRNLVYIEERKLFKNELKLAYWGGKLEVLQEWLEETKK